MCSRGLFAATLVAAAVAARGQPVRGQPVHHRRGRGLLEGNRTLGSRKERGVLVNSLSSPVPIRSDTRREPSETPRRSAVRQIPGRNRTVAAKTQQAKSQQAVKQPASAKKQQKKAQRLDAADVGGAPPLASAAGVRGGSKHTLERWLSAAALAAVCVALYAGGPELSRMSGLPLITIYMVGGLLAAHGIPFAAPVLDELRLLHQMSLGVITLAAGSELVLNQLRLNARAILVLTLSLCVSALVLVSSAMAVLLSYHDAVRWPAAAAHPKTIAVISGVIAIARSPSSAIAIVTEQRADGPFTQTMLGTTMVSDVLVVLLFIVVTDYAEALAAERGHPHLPATALSCASHLALSLAHGAVLAGLARLLFWLVPHAPRADRHSGARPPDGRARSLMQMAGLAALCAYAFAAEGLVRSILHAALTPPEARRWGRRLRLEPMLACMAAGFALCNGLVDRRKFSRLLHRLLSPCLLLFFFTTGADLHLGALRHCWQMALGLFAARLVALVAGSYVGSACVGAPRAQRLYGGLSYVTQAGLALGLIDELGDEFPSWALQLREPLVSVIVLNQLVGPPLLEMALRAVGEAGLASAAAGEEEDDDDESSPMRATASEVSTLAANTTPAKGDADGVELAESGELRTP